MSEQETLIAYGDAIKAYKSADGKTGTVEALGVRYGDHKSVDFYGDYFTPETDFGAHKGNGMAATLNHRIPMWKAGTTDDEARVLERLSKMKFANPVETEATEAGILARHILDLSNEYERIVFEMAEAGHLRWSSGTAAHMVDRDVDGEIKTWHVIEWAYTPQPAEPRLPRIAPIKSLEGQVFNIKVSTVPEADDIDESEETEVKTGTPEDAGTASEPVADVDDDSTDNVKSSNPVEDSIMSEAQENGAVQSDPRVVEALAGLTETLNGLAEEVKGMKEAPVKTVPVADEEPKAPAVLKGGRGDNITKALAAYVRTGDMGGVKHLRASDGQGIDLAKLSVKASNAVGMEAGTAGEGGNAVPTGHYQNIIARRDEEILYPKLGLRMIGGKGTTVNVPVDNEDDGEFVSTDEEAQFDLDSPDLASVAMTLGKYTKRILLTDELLEDEDSNLMAFIEDWVGRGWARTHNSLLLTALYAGGTSALDLDSPTAIASAEIPELQYTLPDGYENDAAWIMKKATLGNLRGKTGDDFQFSQMPYASGNGMQFFIDSYPVHTSGYAEGIGTNAAITKPLIFGNFGYVGLRVMPELKLIVDPFTRADYGQVRRIYSFRAVYKVLQAEAIRYARNVTT